MRADGQTDRRDEAKSLSAILRTRLKRQRLVNTDHEDRNWKLSWRLSFVLYFFTTILIAPCYVIAVYSDVNLAGCR
jgi:hypothetical protein